MKINPTIGVKPDDVLETPLVLVLSEKPLLEEKRDRKDGKGKFTQFALKGVDGDGIDRSVRYLFEQDFQPLVKAFGDESDNWAGKKVSISAVKEPSQDGNAFYNRIKLAAA